MTHQTESDDEFDPAHPETVYGPGKYVATLNVVRGVHDGNSAQFIGSEFESREEVFDAISAPRGCMQVTICVEFARYDGDHIDGDLRLGNGDGVILVNEDTKEVHSLGTGFTSAGDIEYAMTDEFYGVSDIDAPHRVCLACDAKKPEWAIDEALHLLRDEWMENDQLTLGELLSQLSDEAFGDMDVRCGDPEALRRTHIIDAISDE